MSGIREGGSEIITVFVSCIDFFIKLELIVFFVSSMSFWLLESRFFNELVYKILKFLIDVRGFWEMMLEVFLVWIIISLFEVFFDCSFLSNFGVIWIYCLFDFLSDIIIEMLLFDFLLIVFFLLKFIVVVVFGCFFISCIFVTVWVLLFVIFVVISFFIDFVVEVVIFVVVFLGMLEVIIWYVVCDLVLIGVFVIWSIFIVLLVVGLIFWFLLVVIINIFGILLLLVLMIWYLFCLLWFVIIW